MNNKGFTLVEMLAAITIAGILVMGMTGLFAAANKQIARLNSTILLAQSIKVDKSSSTGPVTTKVLALDKTCKAIEGGYYGYTTDGDTLNIFTDARCKASMGTLDRLKNEGWFNEATHTDWKVFANGQLKILLVTYP